MIIPVYNKQLQYEKLHFIEALQQISVYCMLHLKFRCNNSVEGSEVNHVGDIV